MIRMDMGGDKSHRFIRDRLDNLFQAGDLGPGVDQDCPVIAFQKIKALVEHQIARAHPSMLVELVKDDVIVLVNHLPANRILVSECEKRAKKETKNKE